VCVGKKSRASTDGTRYTYLFYYMILVPFFYLSSFSVYHAFLLWVSKKKGPSSFQSQTPIVLLHLPLHFLDYLYYYSDCHFYFCEIKGSQKFVIFYQKRILFPVLYKGRVCFFFVVISTICVFFFLVVMSVFCIWPPRFYIKQTKKKNKKCSCKKREKGISPRKRLQRNVLCFS